jgi:hypothetical protein
VTHQRDVHRSHTDQRITALFKLHEALRKTLQKPNPASGGNDATAGMPPVDRAADELHAAPASIIEREAGQTVGMPSADRAAAEIQAAPLNVMEREAEQTVGTDRSAAEIQVASPVIEHNGIPKILVGTMMLVAGFGIYLLFVIRVVIPFVCHTRL